VSFSREKRQETLIYLVLWGLIFIAPVLSLSVRTASDDGQAFNWSEVLMVWREYGIFLAAFLIHNHLLAPLLVYRQRRTLYISVVVMLVALFAFYQCSTRPDDMGRHMPRHEMTDNRLPSPMDGHRPPEFEGHRPPEHEDHRPPELEGQHSPKFEGKRPPIVFSQHDTVATIVLILMLLANLGVKTYFKQRNDQQLMAELEHKNLEQRLEYLKYQLNPHFLMNTLNNIHALVDIDPEQSKESIIELSKILRYVLYESNHERVSMTKEREFMDNYCHLMRMRYGDKLSFSVTIPDNGTGVSVPPLLFVSFVENAFKHGVSYQKPSFIAIDCKRYKDKHDNERLLWICRNSKHPRPDTSAMPSQGGVGMTNIRQRLDLIYGNDYTLGNKETEDTYEVILDIPLG